MSLVPDLPTDIEALQQLIVQQWEEIARLEHDKRELIRLVFGRSSEKRRPPAATGTPGQGYLFLQEIAAEAARLAEQHRTETTVTVAAHQRQKTGRRATFPEHLPVVQTLCELPEGQRACGGCGGALKEFGEDVTRELERVETTVIHEIRRKKYACPQCQQGVVTASWRGRVIEKGLLGPGFLAHVITERFGHHLPYYRLEGKYKSEGLDLSRSVLCESMSRCAELLEPIAEHLRQEVLAAPVIHTDDTPVTLAKSSQGGPREARVWVYLNRDGRHWYDFTESRKRDGPARVFGNYTGYIQADAYGGYDQLFLPGGAIEVGCWSHYLESNVIRSGEPKRENLAVSAAIHEPVTRDNAGHNEERKAKRSGDGLQRVAERRSSPARAQKALRTPRFISRLVVR